MKDNVAETIIGAIVVLVAAGFLVVMSQTAGLSRSSGAYGLTAKFQSAEGIVVGSDVRLAGVKIGTVTSMSLDPQTYLADMSLSVTDGVLIPDDSEAGIATEGLLGGAFVDISPGASEFMLGEGEEILNTQSAVSFINLLLRFVGEASQ